MKIDLEVVTHNRLLVFDMLQTRTAGSGQKSRLFNGVTVECREWKMRKSIGTPDILRFTIESSARIDLSFIATWLYDKVKLRKIEKMVVNNVPVQDITETGIRGVLEAGTPWAHAR